MHPRKSSTFGLIILIIFTMGFASSAWAGKVVKVKSKGKKVYIKLSSKEKGMVMVGDKIRLSKKGSKKTKAIVRVTKVKGRMVIAKRVKGKAKKGLSH